MDQLKPRSKSAFLKILKDIKVSKEAKSTLAGIAVEIESVWSDSFRELRTDILDTLLSVEVELKEHDTEYQHMTSPELKDAVQRCITKLQRLPK